MPKLDSIRQKTTTLRTTHKGRLHKEDLVELLGVPQSAKIYVNIPSDGDWSGEALDLQDSPIHVEWTETDELEIL